MGRSWVSAPGASLTFSVLLRPGSVPAARRGWLPLLTGVAVASAVRDVSGVTAVLKWPNDVLAGSRKLAGILAEQSGDAVVVGIGLNVATPADALPVSPSGLPATSLLLRGCCRVPRDVAGRNTARAGTPLHGLQGRPRPRAGPACCLITELCARPSAAQSGWSCLAAASCPAWRKTSTRTAACWWRGWRGAPPVAVSAGDVIHVRQLRHLHRDFVVRDTTLVPAAERCPGGVLDYRALVVVPREPANRVQVREPGNGGEGGLPAFVPAQQLGGRGTRSPPSGAR